MRQTWRWFGPHDSVSVDDMLQAGVEGVVTALHHVQPGEVWTKEEIAKRQGQLSTMTAGAPSGLRWEVVESLPVSEDIKKQTNDWRRHIANYKTSLEHLAAAGIETICYNFMPVLDWTRTELQWRLANGATCMRFDIADFAAFDIHILQRKGAAHDYAAEIGAEAGRRFAAMDGALRAQITANIVTGLPGTDVTMSLDDVKAHLAQYDGIDAERLRRHFTDFLSDVVPVAERLGLRLCCHPDDPPFPLLGLPRIMSTGDDYARILDAVDSAANGMTLCSGSLGARPDNDVAAIMDRLGPKVHFIHLRNVKRESDWIAGSFHEAAHLEGDTDMVDVIAAILREEHRRRKAGRADVSIPFRPDHGQNLLDDHRRKTAPGYPAIGRLRGLAELRGIMAALVKTMAA
jgi:mannonate dehydratase